MRVSRTITLELTVISEVLELAGDSGFTEFVENAIKEKLAIIKASQTEATIPVGD